MKTQTVQHRELVIDWMRRRGTDVSSLARDAGVNRQGLSTFLNKKGAQNPTAKFLDALYRALRVDVVVTVREKRRTKKKP